MARTLLLALGRAVTPAVLGLMCLSPASAQQSFGWGPYFGALISPDTAVSQYYLNLDVNLFTELAKELEEPGLEFQRYNGIGSTIGISQLSVQRTKSIPALSNRVRRQRTWHVGAAAIDDALTDFLQNDFMHGLMDRPFVPRGETANGVVLVAGYDESARVSFGKHFEWMFGAGLNAALGLIGEGYVHSGLTVKVVRDKYGLRRHYGQLSCVGRLGAIPRIDALLIDEVEGHLARRAWTAQCLAGVDLGGFFGRPGAAVLDAGLTRTSGLFRASPGQGTIHETLVLIRISLPTYRLVIQTWNDVIASKDQGPTFGLGLSYFWRQGWPHP